MKLFFILIFLCLIIKPITSFGQSNSETIKNYISAIDKIETVSYDVQRIDTFTTGDVWNNKGKCIIHRDSNDSLFGFDFLGKRYDAEENDLYDGHQMFLINDSSKSYTIIRKPGTWILGFTGGQMVVPDIMNADTGYFRIETYNAKDTVVIKLVYKDDAANNTLDYFKLIYLDPLTHLPIKIISSLISLNRRQVGIYILSNIKINDSTIQNIDDKNYLFSYTLKTPEEKPTESLVGKKSPDFTLNSFIGKKVSLSALKGKVILLDFWETWCGPCVKSMPAIEELFEKYSKKGLLVLGIMSEQKSLESARLLIKNKGLTFTELQGNNAVKKMYDVTGVPKFILIDEEGHIMYESSNGFEDCLAKTLKEKFNF
jgi:thiol-disulfide isomerase/thioredoxin